MEEELFDALLYALSWVVWVGVLCLLSAVSGITPIDVARWVLVS